MSYYILPKYTSNKIDILAKWTCEQTSKNIDIINSPSLIHYLNNLLLQLSNPTFLSNFAKINNNISPYKYLYSKLPTYNLSISKLSISPHFYIYIELINICALLDSFTEKNITCTSTCNNSEPFLECISYLREKYTDTHYCIEENKLSDFINIEMDPFTTFNKYIYFLLKSVYYILTTQHIGGVAIIKINHMFYKPVLDILFILNIMYKQVYIIKPQVSNTINNELYIVCKCFVGTCENIIRPLEDIIKQLKESDDAAAATTATTATATTATATTATTATATTATAIISSILADNLPLYFLNKIEEANIIIYHQKIQYFDYIINYKLNSNTQKHNIQKCIQWCERYKIPHNKITDKSNIFLQPVETHLDEEEENIVLNIIINQELVDISSFSKQIELLNLFNTTFEKGCAKYKTYCSTTTFEKGGFPKRLAKQEAKSVATVFCSPRGLCPPYLFFSTFPCFAETS